MTQRYCFSYQKGRFFGKKWGKVVLDEKKHCFLRGRSFFCGIEAVPLGDGASGEF